MWNHRVLIHPDHAMAIHEVHYDKDGNPVAWTDNPVRVTGDSLTELHWQLTQMIKAVNTNPLRIRGKKLVTENMNDGLPASLKRKRI